MYADNDVLTRCARSAAKTGSTYAETMGAHSMQLAGRDQAVRREQNARAAAACGVDLDDRRPHRVDGLDDRLRIRIKQHAIVWLRQHTTIVGGRPTARTTQTGRLRTIELRVPACCRGERPRLDRREPRRMRIGKHCACRQGRSNPAATFTTTLGRTDHFAGTRAFSSSNQFSTRLSCED